ncbi:MAG TPA: hypothetical protein VEH06_09600 [Candidatus Bathyarchaeia archaeon]|nr:hypothetical protein [Candidatus Bathyarchaeia archaeon]
MTCIQNHKTLFVIVAISAIAVVLTGSLHMAFAQFHRPPPGNSITKTLDNQGVNVQTDTNQKQDCLTAGGSSGISGSCTASSTDTVTQSGGILKK